MSASDNSKMGKWDLVCAFSHTRVLTGPPLFSRVARGGQNRSRSGARRQLRDPRARRRIGVEIIMHALMDGGGEFRLMRLPAQPQLFLRVRDIGGLDQHRRDI